MQHSVCGLIFAVRSTGRRALSWPRNGGKDCVSVSYSAEKCVVITSRLGGLLNTKSLTSKERDSVGAAIYSAPLNGGMSDGMHF